MRQGLQFGWLRQAEALALLLGAAIGLGACASEDDGTTIADPWDFIGGQTGSLTPLCGLTPGSVMRGVPASAEGLVVDPSECENRAALNQLAVRDANGQPVAFDLMQLPDGTLLVRFVGGFTPGSYTVGTASQIDDDGGVDGGPIDPPPFDPDAGIGMQPMVQSVEVEPPAPLPTRFGEVARIGGECGAVLDLRPDASVLPYLGLLSVDLEIDGNPAGTLVQVGTLELEDGRAGVPLPNGALNALWDGEHELRVTTRIAGQSVPLETFVLTIQVPCADEYEDTTGKLCAAGNVRSSFARHDVFAVIAPLSVLTLYALRKRRRRTRVS